jgi:predicted transcriptional regulator
MRETQGSLQKRVSDKIESEDFAGLVNRSVSQPEVLEVLKKVSGKIARGPAPSFNEAHVVKALEIIEGHGIVGRTSLSNELELGIGTTRTILKHLKNESLIGSSKAGFLLSEKGKKVFDEIRSRISEGVKVPDSPLMVGPVGIAVLARGMAHEVGRGVEQRNTAIRAGASGATTLVFLENSLVMASKRNHTVSGVSKIQDAIMKLNPKENDVVIIGSGENMANAENGAIMAALKLLKHEN